MAARVLGKGKAEGRRSGVMDGIGGDRARGRDIRQVVAREEGTWPAVGWEAPYLLVTKGTLVLTPGCKGARGGIPERLRNNAPPPALVSSHSFNRLGGGCPARITFAN